jgi:uncharacterized membrane protein
MRTDTVIAILAMAGITWGLRAGGLALARHLKQNGAMARALQQMPACVMAALVAPAVANGGMPERVAAAITVAAMVFTRSLPLAMLAGIGAVVAGRQWWP